MLSFSHLSAVNRQRCALWHPGFPDSGDWIGSDWSNAAAGEMGEACNVVKKLRRQDTGAFSRVDPSYEDLVGKLGDEIADTLIYLDLLSTYYGINLEEAIIRKFNAISDREGLPVKL